MMVINHYCVNIVDGSLSYYRYFCANSIVDTGSKVVTGIKVVSKTYLNLYYLP